MNRQTIANIIDDFIEKNDTHARLLVSNTQLIEDVASMVMSIFKKEMAKVAWLEQPVMTKIIAEKVDEEKIITGAVEWSLRLVSPMYERKITIGVKFPIIAGMLLRPLTFQTSTGLQYSLNETGLKMAMRVPDEPRIMTNREPDVNRAFFVDR